MKIIRNYVDTFVSSLLSKNIVFFKNDFRPREIQSPIETPKKASKNNIDEHIFKFNPNKRT